MPDFTSTLASWLNRPYLDLGAAPDGVPNHTAALVIDCRSLFGGEDTPWFWSSLNASFREALVAHTGLHEYGVADPRQLPSDLRTSNWQQLCEYLDGFSGLDTSTQVKVARLLNRLTLFSFTRQLIPASVGEHAAEGADHAALAWLRAMAGYRMQMEAVESGYTLAEFEQIALAAPAGLARINPLYQLVVQNVKSRNDLAATEHWQERHQAAILEARDDLDKHDYLMAISRSHRVAAFIPQMKRDAEGTVREMDLAEQYAREMDFGTQLQRAYAKELLYPVLESRIKEALWLQDMDLALSRALLHRDNHPLDSRVWVHAGEVYLERDEIEEALGCFREAARLAPPGGEIALFMAGQCYEELEQLDAALEAYTQALRIDPLGISAAEGIVRVAEALGSKVHRWAVQALNELERMRDEITDAPAARGDAYQNLPTPAA